MNYEIVCPNEDIINAAILFRRKLKDRGYAGIDAAKDAKMNYEIVCPNEDFINAAILFRRKLKG